MFPREILPHILWKFDANFLVTVAEANFSSRAFPTGTEYASWETDEVF
jgi:hypothetical protein